MAELTEDSKKTYKALIVLNEVINGGRKFQTVANGDDKILEPIFVALMSKGYMQASGLYYDVTAKGHEVYDTFMKRYSEYLKVYDVFSYVDLEKGEFAFARFFDFETDDAWDDFKNDQRFEDLRLAVARFKKIDPTEIVFMSFINENRFDTTSTGWQMDVVSDNTWKEIDEICDTAIKPEEVGEDAMEDMVRQGADLMIKLLEEENKQKTEIKDYNNQNNNQNNNNQTGSNSYEVYETVEYYQPYYDPWYVSPIWLVPLFLW